MLIGEGLLEETGALAAGLKRPGQAVVITDSNVDSLYAGRLCSSLRGAGFSVLKYVIPAGEASKNPANLISILNFMAGSRLARDATVFALGGGVVGDISGLAASLYMRGVGLIQLPTTLLAAVDSSVGGKTAVNLEAGKNLAGSFYQPDLVICDTGTLKTLPPRERSNGFAEVIKYGFIRDDALLELLEQPGEGDIAGIIERCVSIKRDIVGRDERDTGERQLLNFGHTFGHAIERATDYAIPHGHAVACGMVIVTAACAGRGLCDAIVLERLKNLLLKYNLPLTSHLGGDSLFCAVQGDKKRQSDRLNLVIPRRAGHCELKNLALDEVREYLMSGTKGEGL